MYINTTIIFRLHCFSTTTHTIIFISNYICNKGNVSNLIYFTVLNVYVLVEI